MLLVYPQPSCGICALLSPRFEPGPHPPFPLCVFRRGSDLLVKLVNPDAAKPAVDLEQRPLIEALMALLLGDQVGCACVCVL